MPTGTCARIEKSCVLETILYKKEFQIGDFQSFVFELLFIIPPP